MKNRNLQRSGRFEKGIDACITIHMSETFQLQESQEIIYHTIVQTGMMILL